MTAQAYAGAAVARTANGQFAPAINSSKRRRTEGSVGPSQPPLPPRDAEYPGLPAGMKRPSLQVSAACCACTVSNNLAGSACTAVLPGCALI